MDTNSNRISIICPTCSTNTGGSGSGLMMESLDVSETSASDDGRKTRTTDDRAVADLAEAIRYGCGVERLLDRALGLIKDITTAAPKGSTATSGAAKRFNELKNSWKDLSNSVDSEVLKQIREQ